MKLIDLLVQELPKRGGWPKDATEICWHGKHENYAYFYGAGGAEFGSPVHIPRHFTYEGDANGFDITREQYEAALAALKQVEWNGFGVPLVGQKCKRSAFGADWAECEVLYVGPEVIVLNVDGREIAYKTGSVKFHPLLTEAERKREEAIKQMMDCSAVLVEVTAGLIYDAIAAGKIPHIKLESADE